MPKLTATDPTASHFRDRDPNVAATYAALLRAARALGPVIEEAKKTSIHLVRESAFAGVATQKAALILTRQPIFPFFTNETPISLPFSSPSSSFRCQVHLERQIVFQCTEGHFQCH